MLNVIEELKTAMKMPAGAEKDARLLVVRELKNKETELYPEKADAKLQHKWLEKMKAERSESAAVYTQNGRDDLAARENAELAVICSLLETVEKDLPRKLTEEECRKIITDLKSSNNQLNIGIVMKHFKANYADVCDNALVSRLCKEML